MGVLDTGADSVTVLTVGGGRLTTCAGVPTESLDAGGPKFGRRRLRPNPLIIKIYKFSIKIVGIYTVGLPVKETSSSCKEFDRLLVDAAGILLASRTGVDIDSSA